MAGAGSKPIVSGFTHAARHGPQTANANASRRVKNERQSDHPRRDGSDHRGDTDENHAARGAQHLAAHPTSTVHRGDGYAHDEPRHDARYQPRSSAQQHPQHDRENRRCDQQESQPKLHALGTTTLFECRFPRRRRPPLVVLHRLGVIAAVLRDFDRAGVRYVFVRIGAVTIVHLERCGWGSETSGVPVRCLKRPCPDDRLPRLPSVLMGVIRVRRCKLLAIILFGGWAMCAAAQQPRTDLGFRTEQIDDQVRIGYGVAIGDVDGDARPDIVLADKTRFVWYRNPDWKRFVLAQDLTPRDNVCLAVRDVNGDGKVEIAVGAAWNPGDTQGSGAVFYLQPPNDRTQPWTPIRLHHEPVVHRMRWMRLAERKFVLVVAPLHGRGNRNGEGAGVRLLAYRPPTSVYRDGSSREPWATEVLHDAFHVTHNFDVGQWIDDTQAEELAYLGKEGAVVIEHGDSGWRSRPLERVGGGGEIRMGRGASGQQFLATIEPFHGSKLVWYDARKSGDAEFSGGGVLADDLAQGHALATANIDGKPGDELIVGWRNPNADGEMGLRIYGRDQRGWSWQWIDRNGIAVEDVRVADLNNDGRADIVAAGRSTHNLRIYWNEPR